MKNYDVALLESYYYMNNFFLTKNYILKHAHKIQHLPITLIVGRQDLITPPLHSYQLYKKLLNASLLMIDQAAHSYLEPNLSKVIKEQTMKLSKSLSKKSKNYYFNVNNINKKYNLMR